MRVIKNLTPLQILILGAPLMVDLRKVQDFMAAHREFQGNYFYTMDKDGQVRIHSTMPTSMFSRFPDCWDSNTNVVIATPTVEWESDIEWQTAITRMDAETLMDRVQECYK